MNTEKLNPIIQPQQQPQPQPQPQRQEHSHPESYLEPEGQQLQPEHQPPVAESVHLQTLPPSPELVNTIPLPPPPSTKEPLPMEQEIHGTPMKTLKKEIPDVDSQDFVKIKFINQGAYGCVYKPEITCDGKIGNPNYISKIQIDNISVKNEILIGKEIKKIPHFESYFAPILENCPVNINAIDKPEQDKCDILNEKPASASSTQAQQPQQQTQENKPNQTSFFNLFNNE